MQSVIKILKFCRSQVNVLNFVVWIGYFVRNYNHNPHSTAFYIDHVKLVGTQTYIAARVTINALKIRLVPN